MTSEETIEKMMRLRLPHMAHAFRELLDRAAGGVLTVEEGVGLLIDREWTERENRRTARRLKDAKLGMQACMEDLWCDPARGLDKSVLRSMATCQWVRAKQNILVIGATGTGMLAGLRIRGIPVTKFGEEIWCQEPVRGAVKSSAPLTPRPVAVVRRAWRRSWRRAPWPP